MREDTSVQGGPRAAKADSLAPLPPPVHPLRGTGRQEKTMLGRTFSAGNAGPCPADAAQTPRRGARPGTTLRRPAHHSGSAGRWPATPCAHAGQAHAGQRPALPTPGMARRYRHRSIPALVGVDRWSTRSCMACRPAAGTINAGHGPALPTSLNPCVGRCRPWSTRSCGACRPAAGTTVTRPVPAAAGPGRRQPAGRLRRPRRHRPAPPPGHCRPPRHRPGGPWPRHWPHP